MLSRILVNSRDPANEVFNSTFHKPYKQDGLAPPEFAMIIREISVAG
jgi:hypothetical protein